MSVDVQIFIYMILILIILILFGFHIDKATRDIIDIERALKNIEKRLEEIKTNERE